ncbi:RNA polymerase I specific transcription initiation factor Rrn7 [Blumeria hordei DH14]|uniref:RNA polymerase I specific transcription initiation factor Rrn7 n=1 Tax=Blumeria graminis f. sp. hordei (strain DH14) TaxID=546991 RepID=N1JGL6_BLUG1|nr:RNA polymerase I specific transcription initiation factor Rrn7 [Blumeria hordei DH14]
MSSQAVEYKRFQQSESCSEEGCRAAKFYIEDGKKFCQRGHEQDGFTVTQQDEDDFLQLGKVTHKKREVHEHAAIKCKGIAAKKLYLQCIQLVLCKQCNWLVTEKNFAPEIETIVRDLWELRLKTLWLEEESNPGFFAKKRGTVSDSHSHPQLIETLSLCYLAALLLRLPISLSEVLGWASRGEILMKKVRIIPIEMRTKLPAYFYSALEMKAPLNGNHLQRKIMDLTDLYYFHFKMIFPPLNTPLLSYKHIQDLGLPVEIYPAVKRLASILDVNFSFDVLSTSIRGPLSFPEIRIICLIIIATKLSQPFDSLERIPENSSDPTILKIDWKAWFKIMHENQEKGFKKGEELNVRDTDVWNMDDKKIDQYLDWFQKSWLDERKPKISELILDHFPLQSVGSYEEEIGEIEPRFDKLIRIQEASTLQTSSSSIDHDKTKSFRPGAMYVRYRAIGDLTEEANNFYEHAASKVGVSTSFLVRAVFQMEVQIESWLTATKKKEAGETKIPQYKGR